MKDFKEQTFQKSHSKRPIVRCAHRVFSLPWDLRKFLSRCCDRKDTSSSLVLGDGGNWIEKKKIYYYWGQRRKSQRCWQPEVLITQRPTQFDAQRSLTDTLSCDDFARQTDNFRLQNWLLRCNKKNKNPNITVSETIITDDILKGHSWPSWICCFVTVFLSFIFCWIQMMAMIELQKDTSSNSFLNMESVAVHCKTINQS